MCSIPCGVAAEQERGLEEAELAGGGVLLSAIEVKAKSGPATNESLC
jgi:hypothetical protein